MYSIKDSDGNFLTDENEILSRWREYFEDLLNSVKASTRDTHEVTHLGEDKVFTAAEVATAIKGIKSGKATGEDEIRPELLKALTGEGILWLTRVCQVAWKLGKTPRNWQTGVIIPIFKIGDRKQYTKYRAEVESRTQGSRPRPRTQKNPRPRPRTAFPRTDTLEAKERNARGQGHKRKCSPKKKKVCTKNLKKKKRSSQKFFKQSPQKNVFQKDFQALHKISTIQKLVLSSAEDRPIFEDLRPRGRGQGQGLDLRDQGQGLQNVFSRTSSRPSTSSRTPPLVQSDITP